LFIVNTYGQVVHDQVLVEADCEVPPQGWKKLEKYPDADTIALVVKLGEIVGAAVPAILESFGEYFIGMMRRQGYSNMLACQGSTVRSWLENVNEMHEHLRLNICTSFMFPYVYCSDDLNEQNGKRNEDKFCLHYQSTRGSVLAPLMAGIVKAAALHYFGNEVKMELTETQGHGGATWTSWNVILQHCQLPAGAGLVEESIESPSRPRCPFSGIEMDPLSAAVISIDHSSTHLNDSLGLPSSNGFLYGGIRDEELCEARSDEVDGICEDGGLTAEELNEVFPFYIKFDHFLTIKFAGKQLQKFFPGVLGSQLDAHFTIEHPRECTFRLEDLKRCQMSTFELVSISNPRFKLTGGLFLSSDPRSNIAGHFMLQPAVFSLDAMAEMRLNWDTDMPRHSTQRRLIMMAEHLKTECFQNEVVRLENINKERALEMKRLFVRYVSHEIRTPLSTCSIGLELVGSMRSRDVTSALFRAKQIVQESSTYEFEADAKLLGDASTNLDSIFSMIEEIKESTDIAVGILNDLLLYEKIEGGLLALERKPYPAVQIITDAIRPFSIQSRAAKVELVTILDDSFSRDELVVPTVFICVDKSKIQQVVRNLVSNALKFSPEGSTVTIKMAKITCEMSSKEQARACVRIEVTDSGAGMAPENIKELFSSIIQFDSERLQCGGGSGIGLYVSKGIIDLHNGVIKARSAGLGMGSTFQVDIPIHNRGDAPLEAADTPWTRPLQLSLPPPERSVQVPVFLERPTARSLDDMNIGAASVSVDSMVGLSSDPPDRKRAKGLEVKSAEDCALQAGRLPEGPLNVLVVDDSKAARKMVCRFLAMSKISLSPAEAEDGNEAVASVVHSELGFDLILMDYSMPNKDGPEATEEIRRLGFCGLIVGVTGNLQANDTSHFLSAGADIVLSKPLDIAQLKKIVQDYQQPSSSFPKINSF